MIVLLVCQVWTGRILQMSKQSAQNKEKKINLYEKDYGRTDGGTDRRIDRWSDRHIDRWSAHEGTNRLTDI